MVLIYLLSQYSGKLDFCYFVYAVGYVIVCNPVCGTNWTFPIPALQSWGVICPKILSRQGYCRGWSCLPQADLEQYWYISLEAHHVSFIQQLALLFKVTISRRIIFSLVCCHIELILITGLKEDGWTRLDLIFLYLSFEIWNHSVGKSMPFFKSRITFFWTFSHFITKIIFPENFLRLDFGPNLD